MHKLFLLAFLAFTGAMCLQCGASPAPTMTSTETAWQDSLAREPYQSATVLPAKFRPSSFEDRSLRTLRPHGLAPKTTAHGVVKPMPQGALAKPQGALAKPLPHVAMRPGRPSAQLRKHVAAYPV